VFRVRSSVLSLVALSCSFAWGCSSSDEGGSTTPEAGLHGAPAPFPTAAGAATPATPAASSATNGGQGTASGAITPASSDNSEGVTPVAAIDPGTASGTGGPAAGGGSTPAAGTGTTPTDTPAPPPPAPIATPFVEDSGLACTIGNLPNAIAANAKAPNPFTKLDGTIIATKADWVCRRKEIRAQAEKSVYGTKPGKPDSVTGTLTNTSLSVNVSNQGKTASFNATVTLPTTGTAPFPAVFGVGGPGGVDQATFLSQGVAVINFDPNSIGQETNTGGSPANRQNKMGPFYTLYGNGSSTGLLAAWAWGVSRYIDVIEASDGSLINKNALGVMGCSRNGKAALAIGALDERIALSVPFESGTGGVPLYRAVAQAELGNNGNPSQSLPSAFSEQAWFGDAFNAFLTAANTVPIDTHEILALFAPRGLLILDNPFIGELTPRGAHAAALAGVEVFKALGVQDNFSYLSNTDNGTHCAIRPEYQEPLRQAIQKHLFKNAAATAGTIQTSQTFATANPQDWIDWITPTLQ
jgi:hypothetical protein